MKVIKLTTALLAALLIVSIFMLYVVVHFTDIFERKNTPQGLYKSCLISMKNNNCSIMLGPQALSLNAKDNQVLIVGVGKVDSTIYRQFRDNPQMCFEIKASCQADLNSSICRLAKSMYQSDEVPF